MAGIMTKYFWWVAFLVAFAVTVGSSRRIIAMYGHGSNDVRYAAESLYQQAHPRFQPSLDFPRTASQTHSINLYTDDYIAGFSLDGRMSNVRRFFCLFVTFDLFFISLLWLICVLITGADIFDVMKSQIVHFNVHSSTFDIVMAAVCRFVVLVLFYAIVSLNHWIIIALSTSGSCSFLIYKVFAFNWVDQQQPVFQVLLIVVSFVLAWGEAWFLDFKVIPQERLSRHFASVMGPQIHDDRSPLVSPFLGDSQEVAASFYSPFESIHNSDDENEDQEEEYRKMGRECVMRATKLLEMGEWKFEKLTSVGDTIQSLNLPKMGKVWRVTARVQYPARKLLDNLFYEIETIQNWNPTILESKIIQKIDQHTDVTYQATAGAGNGMIKSRDFVNLRCWHLCRNGHIVEPEEYHSVPSPAQATQRPPSPGAAIARNGETTPTKRMIKSLSINRLDKPEAAQDFGLSKSVGASGFYPDDDICSGDDDQFTDAEDDSSESVAQPTDTANASVSSAVNVYVSSAISIEHPKMPMSPKYTRGENLLTCWAMREIDGNPDACIFEWIMCINLRGYFLASVLNSVYPTIIQDYMASIRKHCEDLRATETKPESQTNRS